MYLEIALIYPRVRTKYTLLGRSSRYSVVRETIAQGEGVHVRDSYGHSSRKPIEL